MGPYFFSASHIFSCKLSITNSDDERSINDSSNDIPGKRNISSGDYDFIRRLLPTVQRR